MRAIVTRDAAFHDVPVVVPIEPEVGASLQLFLESGKVMRTSAVQHVARRGSELVVDTANSRYRITPAKAG